MSNIKQYKEAIDLLHDVVEAHFHAGDLFPLAILAFDQIGDVKAKEYLSVLFEQSKRFAGKLKQVKEELEKELD